MRISTLAAAIAGILAFGCTASPALAQALILQTSPVATEAAPPAASDIPPPAGPPQAAPPKPEMPPPVADRAPASVPAPPAASAPPEASSRYSFNRVDGGFLRLDGVSGQIAFCGPRMAGWTCQAVPEDRAALETEIARLQDEVTRLKSEIASLRVPPSPPRPPAELAPPPKDEPKVKLPSSEDLERARVIIEDAWKRLVDMIDALRKDMMRKG